MDIIIFEKTQKILPQLFISARNLNVSMWSTCVLKRYLQKFKFRGSHENPNSNRKIIAAFLNNRSKIIVD